MLILLGGMSFLKQVRDLIEMASLCPSYGEVYGTLSYHVWKTGQDIRKELATQHRVHYFRINTASIYSHLRNMHDRGLAEIHFSTNEYGVLAEYKLTETGLRKRVERDQLANLDGILGVPATS